jgi:hypothetical protein
LRELGIYTKPRAGFTCITTKREICHIFTPENNAIERERERERERVMVCIVVPLAMSGIRTHASGDRH